MITVHIYTENRSRAKEIAHKLIYGSLAAFVSISETTECLSLENEQITTKSCYCIKAHTQALLYNKINHFLNEHYGSELMRYATPITNASDILTSKIRALSLVKEPIL